MNNRVFLALACVLLIVRLPSLVQPMGADQGLYAYIGDRILDGDVPYRDAWDQKPPAIHYTYAALRSVLPAPAMVPAADLAVALAIAALLLALGTTLAGRGVGQAAALLYLFLADPSFHRLAGVAVRAQCETFIAVLVTGAFLLLARSRTGSPAPALFCAGLMIGAAAVFKYNAAVYAGAALMALWLWKRLTIRAIALVISGCAVAPLVMLAVFALTGAFDDWYFATILYNLQYSGQTYEGAAHPLTYLLTFPIQHARVDALWLLGGAGCAVLLFASFTRRERLLVPVWVAAACVVIAINGSRGLPQYFVQALPPLALAAAWAGSLVRARRAVVNLAAVALLAFAVWRVNEFSNYGPHIVHDAKYVFGRMSRHEHLAKYGDRDVRKYSALAMAELADFVKARTAPTDTIYVFGFSSGTYVLAERESASRFFWSRPVIVNFNGSDAGYGIGGLRADLERAQPAIVALQIRDWMPDVPDSAAFFMSTPPLADWLTAAYVRIDGPAGFEIWQRR